MGRARHRRRRWDFEVGVVKGLRNYWVKEEIAHAKDTNILLTPRTQSPDPGRGADAGRKGVEKRGF